MDPWEDYAAVNQIMKERHQDRLKQVIQIERAVRQGHTVDVTGIGMIGVIRLLEQRRLEREQASKGK